MSTQAGLTDIYNAAISMRLPRVVKMELILTEACNMGCSYCFEYDATPTNTMSKETAFAAVDYLVNASRDSDWVSICFMGGEPLLAYNLIKDVVLYAQEVACQNGKSISFDMQTNGIMLREDHCRFFRENHLQYCLSLDGDKLVNDQHRRTLGGMGTFQIVARKMEMLKRFQHWQGARMTVTPESARQLAESIKHLHEELAINQFIIGFATHVKWTDFEIAEYGRGLMEAFDYFVEQRAIFKSRRIRIGLFELGQLNQAYSEQRKTSWGCGAGSARLAVAPNGSFHGCSKLAWRMSQADTSPPLPLGATNKGFDNHSNRLKLLDHTDQHRVKCQTCEIRNYCNGGCYAANLADTGEMYVPEDYFCKLMFAQKRACDYARKRLGELKVDNLYWTSDIPDLTAVHESERLHEFAG